MVIEDEEISRNLCNYLSQYDFFQRNGPGSYYLGGANLDKVIGFDLLPDV